MITKGLMRFSQRTFFNDLCINNENKFVQRRLFKNFGHKPEKEPVITKLYAMFLSVPLIFFLPTNWTWLKSVAKDFVTMSISKVPDSYYGDD